MGLRQVNKWPISEDLYVWSTYQETIYLSNLRLSWRNELDPVSINLRWTQARSQDLKKGGGGLILKEWEVCIRRWLEFFIDLESVSDGLSEIWDEMSRKHRKFKGFFRPKLGDLQKKKKKKVFAKIQSDFSAEIRNSKVFSTQS